MDGRRGQVQPRRPLLALAIGVGFVAALVIIDVLAPNFFESSLPDRVSDGFQLTLSVLIESLPFVALGIVLSIAIQVWIPAEALLRYLPRNGFLRRAMVSLLGMVFPVCECGNVPFARGLLARGLGPADALGFLIAAPIVNPIVIITTHQAFGMSDGILVARLVGGYVVANLIAWIYSRHPDPQAMLTERFLITCEANAESIAPRFQQSISQFIVELRAVMPALVIGSVIAGAAQVLIPRSTLIAIGSNPVLSIVAMILLAVIIAICSNVDAFFALSFASTFSSGSLVAFLLVGPVVDVKMLALMRTTFTTRVLAVIVVVVVLFAFGMGMLVNFLV